MKRLASAALAVLLIAMVQPAHAQPRNPVRDLATVYGARPVASAPPAVQAAYGARDVRGDRPTPAPTGATERDYGYADFGRRGGGFPQYGDPSFPAQSADTAPQEAPDGQEADNGGDRGEFTVSEGFFFDNYTSGSGFGVYGGEAVSSGSGDPRISLPSAGQNARNLGLLPDGYAATGSSNGGQATAGTAPR